MWLLAIAVAVLDSAAGQIDLDLPRAERFLAFLYRRRLQFRCAGMAPGAALMLCALAVGGGLLIFVFARRDFLTGEHLLGRMVRQRPLRRRLKYPAGRLHRHQ